MFTLFTNLGWRAGTNEETAQLLRTQQNGLTSQHDTEAEARVAIAAIKQQNVSLQYVLFDSTNEIVAEDTALGQI